ncbi:MAG TPA: hypothetical protein DEA08_37055 [Planctomycetes bacterium]|nr:hypothetical protein [Planctomycetota bacterium]
MADIEIRFRMNMKSGKKDIVIDFHGDEDLMRHEHEKKHREVVERLVGEGVIMADEVGEVIVERAQPGQPVQQQEPPQDQRQAEGNAG